MGEGWCMGSILQISWHPTPRMDGAGDGLAALVDVIVLDTPSRFIPGRRHLPLSAGSTSTASRVRASRSHRQALALPLSPHPRYDPRAVAWSPIIATSSRRDERQVVASGRGTATNGEVSRLICCRAAMIERPSWIDQPVPTEPA